MTTTKLKQAWARMAVAWAAVHVEHHGMYSVERLHQLNQYQNSTSLLRSWMVIVLTPLPCLAIVSLLDMIPIEPPSLGLDHSHMFWLRLLVMVTAVVMTSLVQMRHIVPEFAVSAAQIVWIASVVGASTVATTIGVGCLIGFPVPFTLMVNSPGLCISLAMCLYVVWGKLLRENAEARAEFIMYVTLVAKLLVLLYVYAVFNYAFNSLVAFEQTAFALLLPVLKLTMKNWIDKSIVQAEDFRPELIIFNVEIFHALNVAFSMQNATSRRTIVVLMVLDCTHAFLSICRLNSVAKSVRVGLQFSSPDIFSSLGDSMRIWRQRVVPLRETMAAQQPQLLRLVLLMLETDQSILQNSAIRLKSSTGSNNLSTPLGAKTLPCATQSDPAFEKRKPDTEPKSARAPRSPTAITPTAPPKPKPTLQDNSVLSEEMICIVSSLGPSERREKVENALKLLHMTEFFVLVEYTEVIIPLVYCLYLLVMSNLPNRVYYAQLKDLDDAKLQRTVVNVLMYAFLELLSFLALSWFLGKKLMVSSIYQLAFVLETQWQMVQSKLILWVVLTVQSSLEHFGADYSFQFKWLHANTSQ